MSIGDLNWGDLSRVANVAAMLWSERDMEKVGHVPLNKLFEALREKAKEVAKETQHEADEAQKYAGFGFANPPPLQVIDKLSPELTAIRDRLTDALRERYGQAYVDDLWARLRK